MPTYGYRCGSCGAEFEVWQLMSSVPGADCPTCGGAGRRLFYPAGIVFKGSGFYKTDSRGSEASSTKPAPDGSPTPASPPAKGEPAKSEPARGEPARGEPAKSEPAKSEPAKSEPARSEPAKPATKGTGSPAPAPASGD